MFLRNYTFGVTENEAINSPVGVVSASDQDEGSNAINDYVIRSPMMNPFKLDINNPGRILVKEPLDREADSLYILFVNS